MGVDDVQIDPPIQTRAARRIQKNPTLRGPNSANVRDGR
jgi:hypothetical protein